MRLLWSVKWACQNKRFVEVSENKPPAVWAQWFINIVSTSRSLRSRARIHSLLDDISDPKHLASWRICFSIGRKYLPSRSSLIERALLKRYACGQGHIAVQNKSTQSPTWSFSGWSLPQPKPRLCCWPEWISTHRRSPGWPPTQRCRLQNAQTLVVR